MAINNGTSWPRNGFTPIKRSPSQESYVLRYPASCGANNTPIGVGSPVALVAGICVPCTAGQDPDQAGFGVVMGVYNSSGRPFTQQANKVIVSGANGFVDVLYDPMAEFIVRCEASVGQSDILKNVVLTGGSAISGLPRIVQAVTLPASASVNDLFKFVRFATQNDITGAGIGGFGAPPAAGGGIIVRWNRTVFTPKTTGSNG